MREARIFISYSHHDSAFKDALVSRLKRLKLDGDIDDCWTDDQIAPGSEWFRDLQTAMDRATVAICIISEYFVESLFCTKEELPYLHRCQMENELVLIPFLVTPMSNWGTVRWMRALQYIDASNAETQELIVEQFSSRLNTILHERSVIGLSTKSAINPLPRVDLRRLTAGGVCIGRDVEREELSKSWRASPTCNILILVGDGGVGKSTLVRQWLDDIESDGFDMAQHVFAWTFGSDDIVDLGASAALFIEHALKFFGVALPDTSHKRIDALLSCLQSKRTILVLDGLEALLSGHGSSDASRIHDRGLHTLLTGLAQINPGLCIITTRRRISNLEPYPMVFQYDVSVLSPLDGAAFLLSRGVRGSRSEREELSRLCGHHALTLRLLAGYLQLEGVDHQRFKHLQSDQQDRRPVNANTVLGALEEHLNNGPGIALLRLLALLGSSTTQEEVLEYIGSAEMVAVYPALAGIDKLQFRELVDVLLKMGLVEVSGRKSTFSIVLHSLIISYFNVRTRSTDPVSWRASNGIVFRRLTRLADEYPTTIAGQSILAQAVRHGCAAHAYDDAFGVYRDRMDHGKYTEFGANFLTKSLGSMNTALLALSAFCDTSWTVPAEGLSSELYLIVLNAAAVCLQAEGRLMEAADVQSTSLRLTEPDEESMFWQLTTVNSLCMLGLIRLTLGDLTAAHQALHDAVRSADRKSNMENAIIRVSEQMRRSARLGMHSVVLPNGVEPWVWEQLKESAAGLHIVRAIARTFQARALHLRGERTEAGRLFHEAETHQATDKIPYLYSLPGYYYCDWLIDEGRFNEARARAHRALELAASQEHLLDEGLAQLIIGQVSLREGDRRPSSLHPAMLLIKRALELLIASDQQEEQVVALLALASIRRDMSEFSEAGDILDRALLLIRHFKMAILEVDAELERVQLLLAMQLRSRASEVLEGARGKALALGYYRRQRDIAILWQTLRRADDGS